MTSHPSRSSRTTGSSREATPTRDGSALRVAVLIDRWDPRRGGAEASLAELCAALREAGHEPRVHAAEGQPDVRVDAGVSRWRRARYEGALADSLVESARIDGADVTLGIRHLARVDVLWLHGGSHRVSVRARREARVGRPLESVALRGRHRVMQALEDEALAGGARIVVAPSELVAAELSPSGGTRVVVAANGIDLARFHPTARDAARTRLRQLAGVTDDRPLAVLPARNPELKGADSVARALAALGPDAPVLLVAGARHASRWQRRLARLAGGPSVRVVPEADAVDLAAGADLAVHPTWRDTSSLVTLEALACGTPVVATRRNPAALERDGLALAGVDAVRLVADPSDVDGLAEAMRETLRQLSALEAEARRDFPAALSAAARVPDAKPSLGRIVALIEEAARVA